MCSLSSASADGSRFHDQISVFIECGVIHTLGSMLVRYITSIWCDLCVIAIELHKILRGVVVILRANCTLPFHL